MLTGFDVSSVQGVLTSAQWIDLVARGTRFVIAKCGNGNSGIDPRFAAFVTATAPPSTLVRGCYHFPFPLPNDPRHPGRAPEDQAAAHFRACVGMGSSPGELPATLDCEYPRPEAWGKPLPGIDSSIVDRAFLLDWFDRYLAVYEKLQGRPMIIYGDPWFLKCLAPPAEWASRPLWEAAYASTVPAVAPWAGWSLRQTAGGTTGRLPNGAPVDTDVVVDEATLSMLITVLPPTVPDITPAPASTPPSV